MEREREQKKSSSQRQLRSNNSNNFRFIYGASVLGLAALLACAFFLPSFLFDFRDRHLWQDTVLEARESVDVTLMSASYEQSLSNRMQTFAQGLEAETNYYVSQQDMTVNAQLYEVLQNQLFQMPVLLMIDSYLLPYSFMEFFSVENWKQYVIYNDNYSQGVNFIIWYLEIVAIDGARLEVLMDAETYTLYGIKTAQSTLVEDKEWAVELVDYLGSTLYERSWKRGLSLFEWWAAFSSYYEAASGILPEREREAIVSYYTRESAYGYADAVSTLDMRLDSDEWLGYYHNENMLVLEMPYNEQTLDFVMRFIPDPDGEHYFYPEMWLGVEDICQLIPEFAQEN